ncbi:MAG: RNA methyltransferase [Gammaproteobacteria bacterium]|jgi:tRNA(Leu) C34 or U34 (ribose-2'-O)-methylase TrmL|nr:MAG: RNA methyltransferase [Gammaproteobacteria bacterium]PHR82251.1 MAG: RNA methyltransferase [Colwellia sp.]
MAKISLSNIALGKDLLAKNNHVTIGLTNPKTPSNVGGVMRAAGCYSVDQVLYTGHRYTHAAKFIGSKNNTDTQKLSEEIPLVAIDDFLQLKHSSIEQQLENMPESTKIICVDLVEGATPLPLFQHPDQALYIFGPEDGTIGQAVIDQADDVVYVPTVGCMNLAASVNVLLYDRLAKSLVKQDKLETDNTLIRKSRDTNNQAKVKVKIKVSQE